MEWPWPDEAREEDSEGGEENLARNPQSDRPSELSLAVDTLRERTAPARVSGLRDAARAYFAASLAMDGSDRPLLIVVPTSKDGDLLAQDLAHFAGWVGPAGIDPGSPLRVFPRHDTAPYDRFSPQNFITLPAS